jgi:hypothetical protein
MLLPLGVFFCAALYQGLCVFWVHYAERRSHLPLFVVGCVEATAQLTGIESSFNHSLCFVAYVLGYGVGPVAANLIKRRLRIGESPELERLHEFARILRLAEIAIDGFDEVATLSPRDQETKDLIHRLCRSLPARVVA